MVTDVSSSEHQMVARPITLIRLSSIANAFFGAGLALIFIEAMFFDYFASLATSSFGFRALIGFHLFPSELWFILIGNTLTFIFLARNDFRINGAILRNSIPVFTILSIYTIWFVYGSLAGNGWALQEFREMVFPALSLPCILYWARYVNVNTLFKRTIVPGTILLVIASMGVVHNSALMLGIFFVGYFSLGVLFKTSPWSIIGALLACLPFLFKFAKPMIALLGFSLIATCVLAAYLNPRSVNWILSKFKMRIALIWFGSIIALAILVFVIDTIYDGAIQQIVRLYFLKERLTPSGEIYYADWSGGRLAIWKAAIDSWELKPLFGYGLGSELQTYAKGWTIKVQYHSYLIQALHNTGLIGFVTIVGAWIYWIRRTLRWVYARRKFDEQRILACMLLYVIAILFHGLYGHSLSYSPSSQFFWLCVGFLTVVPRFDIASSRA